MTQYCGKKTAKTELTNFLRGFVYKYFEKSKNNVMLNNCDRQIEDTIYINSKQRGAIADFADSMRFLLYPRLEAGRELVLLCIGTDRITGDSLGPIIGHNLLKRRVSGRPVIYGTLESPVHAKNLAHTMEEIYSRHTEPLVVAVDASLGRPQSVGFVTIGVGALSPGTGVRNSLPEVGDIYVTGIVNSSGDANLVTLQNTRLALVIKLADVITKGFLRTLRTGSKVNF